VRNVTHPNGSRHSSQFNFTPIARCAVDALSPSILRDRRRARRTLGRARVLGLARGFRPARLEFRRLFELIRGHGQFQLRLFGFFAGDDLKRRRLESEALCESPGEHNATAMGSTGKSLLT
jgi:hypothetical protein